MKHGQLIALACITADCSYAAWADPVDAPKGWYDTQTGQSRILTKGEVRVSVGPWQSLGGQNIESWLSANASMSLNGAVLKEAGPVKAESRADAYTITRKVTRGGAGGMSVLYACRGKTGNVRLMQMDAPNSAFGTMIAASKFMEKVCKIEPESTSTAPPAAPAAKPPETVAKAPTPTKTNTFNTARAAAGKPPKGLKDLRGVITMGFQASGMFGTTEEFIALFDDGTYTSDLHNTFGAGKAESRRKKPNRWGRWRMQGGELQLRDDDDDAFEKTRGEWIARPATKSQKLSGCFGRLNSSSGADYNSGTTVGVARTWCFWTDGRFTNSSTAFGRSSNVSMSTSSPKARGRYVIDRYTAHFVYDDGHAVTAAFSFANQDKNHIALNGKRFMGAKK